MQNSKQEITRDELIQIYSEITEEIFEAYSSNEENDFTKVHEQFDQRGREIITNILKEKKAEMSETTIETMLQRLREIKRQKANA